MLSYPRYIFGVSLEKYHALRRLRSSYEVLVAAWQNRPISGAERLGSHFVIPFHSFHMDFGMVGCPMLLLENRATYLPTPTSEQVRGNYGYPPESKPPPEE
jgi:hypothetical protein